MPGGDPRGVVGILAWSPGVILCRPRDAPARPAQDFSDGKGGLDVSWDPLLPRCKTGPNRWGRGSIDG